MSEETMQKVKELIKENSVILDQIQELTLKQLRTQNKIQQLICNLPMIYGRCKKELICQKYCDRFNVEGQTIINVGDIVEFFRYSEKNEIQVYSKDEEFITIPYSKEHFDFFTHKEGEEYPDVKFS